MDRAKSMATEQEKLAAIRNHFAPIIGSKIDDLWLANDGSLPFSIEGSTTRWVTNGLPEGNACRRTTATLGAFGLTAERGA